MGRKVLISILGTSDYKEAIYELNGVQSKPTRFVEEAIIDLLCSDWTKDDAILIFDTSDYDHPNKVIGHIKGSRTSNWLDDGHPEPHKTDNLYHQNGLQTLLQSKGGIIPAIINESQIPEGFNENKIWEIFQDIFEKLKDEDHIYFDATHAFRSIPLFVTSLLSYAKFIKHISIEAIYYGVFEILGPANKIDDKDFPVSERLVPILNLNNIVELQQYTYMADSLYTFGRMSQSKPTESIKEIGNPIDILDDYISVNRIKDIKKGIQIEQFNNTINTCIESKTLPPPAKIILLELQNKLKEYGFIQEDSFKNIEAAIQWAIDFNMLPQAYTMGQEYIITLLSEQLYVEENPCLEPDEYLRNKTFRDLLSSICGLSEKTVNKPNEWIGVVEKYKVFAELKFQDPFIQNLRKSYRKLTDDRNNIDHAWTNLSLDATKQVLNYNKLVENFRKQYQECIELIAKEINKQNNEAD
jgi:CRISPR-associated Csx2 family protein